MAARGYGRAAACPCHRATCGHFARRVASPRRGPRLRGHLRAALLAWRQSPPRESRGRAWTRWARVLVVSVSCRGGAADKTEPGLLLPASSESDSAVRCAGGAPPGRPAPRDHDFPPPSVLARHARVPDVPSTPCVPRIGVTSKRHGVTRLAAPAAESGRSRDAMPRKANSSALCPPAGAASLFCRIGCSRHDRQPISNLNLRLPTPLAAAPLVTDFPPRPSAAVGQVFPATTSSARFSRQ